VNVKNSEQSSQDIYRPIAHLGNIRHTKKVSDTQANQIPKSRPQQQSVRQYARADGNAVVSHPFPSSQKLSSAVKQTPSELNAVMKSFGFSTGASSSSMAPVRGQRAALTLSSSPSTPHYGEATLARNAARKQWQNPRAAIEAVYQEMREREERLKVDPDDLLDEY